jgi:hypothetical protein
MSNPQSKVAALLVVIGTLWLCPSPGIAADAIATADTNWEGVTVDVVSVARKGNVLTVKFAAVNNGSETQQVAFGFTGNNVCYAVDEESGTKYYVLTDQENNPVASAKDWMPNSTHGINREVQPGKTLRVWMKLPAPPPEVSSISLFLNETDPLEDVPITDL